MFKENSGDEQREAEYESWIERAKQAVEVLYRNHELYDKLEALCNENKKLANHSRLYHALIGSTFDFSEAHKKETYLLEGHRAMLNFEEELKILIQEAENVQKPK